MLAPYISMLWVEGASHLTWLVWDHGDFATYKKIQERFAWRDLVDVVLGHMGECMTCQAQ
jgi:hypothetical protein